MYTSIRFSVPAITAALLGASLSLPATAQDAKPSVARGQGLLEEITVTAKKRAASLQETPLSISAFSADQLQRVGATNNYDVALLTPNFSTNKQLGRRLDRPVIRGMAGPAVGGEPNASYFIDGVFVSGSISSSTLGPIERVEILRGPQSATFGRATFAGAVNYVTRQPTDEFEGQIRAVGGTNDTQQISGYVSGPIIEDNLRFFVGAGLDNWGGEWNNQLQAGQAPNNGGFFVDPPQYGDSSDLGGTRSAEITGKLLWSPTSTTDIEFKLGYTETDDDHFAQYVFEPGELNCYLPTDGTNGTVDNRGEDWYVSSQGGFCGTISEKRVKYVANNPFAGPYVVGAPLNGQKRQIRYNLPDFREGMEADYGGAPSWVADPAEPGARREQNRALIRWLQGIGEWDLKTSLAFNQDEFYEGYDLDHTEQRTLYGTFSMYENRKIEDRSFEIILSSPADARVRGSIGVYLFDYEKSQRGRRFTGGRQLTSSEGGLAQWEEPVITTIENQSIFGALDFDIVDNLTFSAEARYAKDEKEIKSPQICNEEYDPFINKRPKYTAAFGQYYGLQLKEDISETALTPRFTLNWQATEDAMFYVLAAKGNKPGEFNEGAFRANVFPCEALDFVVSGAAKTREEKAWTYEGGTKATWLGGRALTNLSVFWIEWTNQTTFATESISGVPTNILVNAGRSEVFGLEFESSFAFTDNFTGSLSYGLSDATFKNFNSSFLAYTTGEGLEVTDDGKVLVDPDANNAAGNQIPFSPAHSVIGSLAYARGIRGELGWFARTDAVWESKRPTGAANLMWIDERTIWNARVGLENSRWTLTGYVNNILDNTAPSATPEFLYFPGAGESGLSWNKDGGAGQPCENVTCRGGITNFAITPSRGTQYGLDLIFRFGGAM